jgi:uncharacterized damage-inducible protein DinB
MDAKDTFVRIWEREFRTTLKVFRAFPANSLDAKPHERSRSVRDLAWQCAIDEGVIGKILDGANDLRNVPLSPPIPETMEEITLKFEKRHREAAEKMKRLAADEFAKNVTVHMRGGAFELNQAEAIWGNLLDQIHHRGQLTIYLRQAGGKVPSIYGPSGDEPAPSFPS